MKMGVLFVVGVCVIFYQYHLSTSVRLDLSNTASGAADGLQISNDDAYVRASKILEDTIRETVKSVQRKAGLSPDVGTLLVRELLNQLGKVGFVAREDDRVAGTRTTAHGGGAAATTIVPPCSEPPVAEKAADDVNPDPIYVITPTYRRPEQIPELTRISHTLMLVRNVHWLVIEDAAVATKQVTDLLAGTGLKFDHLVAPMPDKYKLKKGAKPRGVSNRNRGLQWIRANATKGVFYFADDDNTYDISLFDEIRTTKTVSMFPVGLCTKFGLSSPVLRDGKFIGFYDGWVAGRKFPVDMAGFAINVGFLHARPNATMPFRAGYEEDGFLKSLAPLEPRDVELLADNCTKVLVWHTQTKKNEPSAPLDAKKYGDTNLVTLKRQIV